MAIKLSHSSPLADCIQMFSTALSALWSGRSWAGCRPAVRRCDRRSGPRAGVAEAEPRTRLLSGVGGESLRGGKSAGQSIAGNKHNGQYDNHQTIADINSRPANRFFAPEPGLKKPRHASYYCVTVNPSSLAAMIRVIGGDSPSPVELFHQHNAHQRVRQRQSQTATSACWPSAARHSLESPSGPPISRQMSRPVHLPLRLRLAASFSVLIGRAQYIQSNHKISLANDF